jgi:hypothetical protein
VDLTHTPFRHQIVWEVGSSAGLLGGGTAVYRPTRQPLLNTYLNTAANDTVVQLSTDSVELVAVHAFNVNTTDLFVLFFDGWASEISTTTVPDYVLLIPAGAAAAAGAIALDWPEGPRFPNGLAYRISTSATSLGTLGGKTGPVINVTYR